MSERLLVLDFDGTVTDAEEEGRPFRAGYLQDIANLVDQALAEIEDLAEAFEDEVEARKDELGWVFGGQIVAPASVDPYLRIMPVARMIFDHFEAFTVPAERDRLLDSVLYKYNYQKTTTAFRPGAAAALRALAGSATYVVTNSHTEPVQRKIRQLGASPGGDDLEWLAARVTGRARKYILDPDFQAVPASMRLAGLARPVLLRRRFYYEVLDELRRAEGADWSELLVVGDIFELDLALPLAAGASVGLMLGPFTPSYERDFLAAHPRGRLLRDLSELRPG